MANKEKDPKVSYGEELREAMSNNPNYLDKDKLEAWLPQRAFDSFYSQLTPHNRSTAPIHIILPEATDVSVPSPSKDEGERSIRTEHVTVHMEKDHIGQEGIHIGLWESGLSQEEIQGKAEPDMTIVLYHPGWRGVDYGFVRPEFDIKLPYYMDDMDGDHDAHNDVSARYEYVRFSGYYGEPGANDQRFAGLPEETRSMILRLMAVYPGMIESQAKDTLEAREEYFTAVENNNAKVAGNLILNRLGFDVEPPVVDGRVHELKEALANPEPGVYIVPSVDAISGKQDK